MTKSAQHLVVIAAICGAAICGTAHANPTTVGDFRGTVQSVTSTGIITLSLGSTTTIVRINASSDVYIVGMTGGADGRIVLFQNVGTANAYFYQEHSSASSASDRFAMDANGGNRVLWNGTYPGMGIATYDGTSSRWRFAELTGLHTAGTKQVMGGLWVEGGNASISVAPASGPHLTLQSTTNGNNGALTRWKNYAGTSLFSMGPDYDGDGGQDFWFGDHVNAVTNLLVDNLGTSWLSFGTSYGGMQWDEETQELGLFAQGYLALRVGGPGGGSIKTNGAMYHRRYLNGSLPVKGSNCNGSGTATQHADSSDSRGSVTLGTGATACTLTFDAPWDDTFDNSNQGFPICVANSSTSGTSVAVTSLTDHAVTFTPSTSGTQTIYYHCDGIEPPTL